MNHEPAFPVLPPCDMEGASASGYPYPSAGMTLRDYFAASIIAGLYASDGIAPEPEKMAKDAYAIADAMLEARATPAQTNEMNHLIDDADRELELPPEGHPLHKLGARLTELLDEDQWTACERLLLEGWAHDAIDRKTGANWRDDSSLQVWFPYTHEELARLRETLQGIADADWRRWEELATPDEFVRWAKSRAAHALRPNTWRNRQQTRSRTTSRDGKNLIELRDQYPATKEDDHG